MPKLDLREVITVEERDAKGNIVDARKLDSLPSGVDLGSRVGMAGVQAAQSVLSSGGDMKAAVDAAIKARRGIAESPSAQSDELPSNPSNPELEILIRYVHSIAKLHSGRFEDLTPLGMLEVAMLCPYPVVSFEEWKAKIAAATGAKE